MTQQASTKATERARSPEEKFAIRPSHARRWIATPTPTLPPASAEEEEREATTKAARGPRVHLRLPPLRILLRSAGRRRRRRGGIGITAIQGRWIALLPASRAVLPAVATSATTRPPATPTTPRSTAGASQHQQQHGNPPRHHSSNASAVSASVASVGGGSSSVRGGGAGGTRDPHVLPQHLRAGMALCDPLLAFDGRFVLVGTIDGRIAIYSIVDFDDGSRGGASDDVVASARRSRAEWKEEDEWHEQKMKEEEEKKDGTRTQRREQNDVESSSDLEEEDEEEEESEWKMRDRMRRRERAKQAVEPMLVVTLPQTNLRSGEDQSKVNSSSYDEESTVNFGNVANPPTIVAMCATPGCGASLVEQRDEVNSPKRAEEALSVRSPPLAPTFGEDLLGHVAVVTDDGEVHVLELLRASTAQANGLNGSIVDNVIDCTKIYIVSNELQIFYWLRLV